MSQEATTVLAGRYRLDGRIAAGGVGEVWRAHDLVLDRPVAVKVLRSEYAGQAEALARFQAEARRAGSVSHPNIAQIYDYGEMGAAGAPYLVMELVDGPSLADVLAAGPLDASATMDVLAQAAAGLEAAHAAGLVHRDIKPANLVLGPAGQVKITDFGIAYAAGSIPITRTGMVIGTAAYVAPERLVGGQAGPASDLYSLGVVGYECLTGAPPFAGTPVDLAAAHQHAQLPPLPASVPADVAALITELTAKDPADRPVSAGAAAERAARLRDSLAGAATAGLTEIGAAPFPSRRIDARTATLAGPEWTEAQPRRRPRRGALLAVAGVAAAGLVGWMAASAFTSPTANPPAPASSTPASSTPAIPTVEVNSAALTGQPVSDVSKALRKLGLTPSVAWTQGGGQAGTVISVQPSGAVPVGSTVTVTAVFSSHDHGHGGGDGNGGN